MVKKKINNEENENLDSIESFDSLADSLGASVLSNDNHIRSWIDTGNLALNYQCSGKFIGGGIPSGKMIEIFGNSSSCKTLFALNMLAGVQKAGGISVFLDAEGTLSKDFAEKAAHVDSKKVIVVSPDKIPTLEKCFKMMYNVIKRVREKYDMSKPILIVYDSIAASPSEREFAKTKIEDGMSKDAIKKMGAGAAKPGERAKTCSEELRTLNTLLDQNNCSVVFINQLRQKIGVMYGNDKTTAGGGMSLEYYSTLRLETRASKKIKDKLENVIGMCVSINNKKNKCFRPFIDCKDIHLFFDKGINPFGGLLDLLIKNERISGSSGNYTILEPWANGKNIKFKASKERNDVPVEVLMECPQLVDGQSVDDIKMYVMKYGKAFEAVNSSIEEQVNDEESAEFDY
jgi:recombination protein RecA